MLKRPTASLIGRRIGKLRIDSVESILGPDSRRVRWATYTCSCGKTKKVRLTNLVRKTTKSCGCNRKYGPGEGARNRVCAVYRKNARRSGRRCTLTNLEMTRLFELPCTYCGLPPSNVCNVKGGNGPYKYSGIDRIDNKKDYTVKNCVACCWECNKMKRGFEKDVFLNLVKRIWIFQTRRPS